MLGKMKMPEDDLIQRERQFTQGELKALRFEAGDFEYDPHVRGANKHAMMDEPRIRTTNVNLKRMRDERFETWSRRVADKQEKQLRGNCVGNLRPGRRKSVVASTP